MRILSLIILSTLIFNAFGQEQAAYVRSNVGQPWGNGNNELFMNDVFGAGNWDDLRFETVSIGTLLTGRSIIFLDGSDNGADELETFLSTNLAALESWVSTGGNLFINCAPNEGNGMAFGFGGTELNYTQDPDDVLAADLMHPIFNGPFLPVGSTWSGNSFAHAIITGTGLTTLITDLNDPGQVVLAEKPFGGGRVIFGAMTTTNFHNPQPQADNLRRNILEYLKFNPVPIDAGIASIDSPYSFCAGMHNVVATLANFGLDTLQSVSVNWEFDGVLQTPLNYATPLDTIGSGNNTVEIVLGSKTFLAGEIYTIKVWTSNPNGILDTVNFNDTVSVVVSPGLNGTYTIGGASPDFATFGEAADVLNMFGICGPVVFDVRNGTYFEQISLQDVNGTSATNTITFQSESGDSTTVILSYSPVTFDSNYVVRLHHTNWVTFRDMTLETTGFDYGHVLEILDGSANNTFTSLMIRGQLVETTSFSYVLVYCETGINENNRFHHNTFLNGSSGIYFFGEFNNGNYVPGLEILHNHFTNQYYYGILLGDLHNPLIIGNTITTTESYPYFSGIEIGDVYNGCTISHNHIEAPLGYVGLYLYDTYGSDTTTCLISNNYIFVGGDPFNTTYGMYSYRGTYLSFLHNTVHVTSPSPDSRVVYIYAEGVIEILQSRMMSDEGAVFLNNILANTGGGYVYYLDEPDAISVSDYNDLYSSSTTQFAFTPDEGNLLSFADWQMATGLDQNSFNLDPEFVFVPGFEISEVELNDAGSPTTPLTTTDIEHEPRSATTPDIGADEWTPPALDAALVAFVQFPPPEGTSDVVVVLKNYGLNTLTSADLDWEFDSIAQTQVNWTGSLVTGDTAHVTLGQATFGFINTHDLRVWVSNPNMMSDGRPQNDTLEVNNFFPGLEGIYTIGGTDPDFATFADAVNALGVGGVAGAVTFLVRDGIYSEQLNFDPIIGTSPASTVTFTSESGDSTLVVLQYNSTGFNENYTVRFNGADFITFSQMTLKSLNATFGTVVHLTNQSDHVTLDRNLIEGIQTVSTGTDYALVYSPSNFLNASFTLRDNLLLNGSYGLYFTANFQHPQGTEVSGNTFQNQYTYAVYLDEHRSPVVLGNHIVTNSNYCCFRGIWINDCEQGGELSGNTVHLPLWGEAIFIDDWFGTSGNPVWITNNFVYIGPGTTNTARGIYYGDGSFMNLLYNTVHVSNTGVGSGATPLYHTQGSDKVLQNNIFVNSGGGYALYFASTFGVTLSDYNNFFSTGPGLGFFNSNMATLEDWQNNSGFDAHSFQLDPLFPNDTSYQIREIALNNAAVPVAGVLVDIENESRSGSSPDIGADEWTPPALDAALVGFANFPFPVGNNIVRVILQNYGADTLTTADLDWTLDGVPQPQVQWTGALASGDTVHAALDTTTFVLGESRDIVSWVSNPNGGTDPYPENDTTAVMNAFPGLAGIYTVGGMSPDYNTFTEAVTALTTHGVAGPVTFMVRNGTYTEQLSIGTFSGASASRPIVFRSESGDSTQVILTFGSNSSNNYTVRLNGADYITFSDMTLQATNSTYSRVVDITNGSRDISLENNIIIGNTISSTSSNQALIYATSSLGNDFLNVSDNHIQGGAYGVYFPASSSHASGVQITGNTFEEQYTYAIYLNEHNKPIVNHNVITTNSTYCCYRGIWITNCNLGGELSSNEISLPFYGYGIYVDSWYGTTTDSSWITNNFINIGPGNTNTANGIYLGYAEYSNLLYNTIHVRNTQISSNSVALNHYSGLGKVLKNNLLVNSGGGYAAYFNTTSGIVESDYNDYFTTGENLAYYSGNMQTLEALQLASGRDANSISIDPQFQNNSAYQLTEIFLNASGTPVAGVSVDIEGDLRDIATPDIGADEWTPAPVDAALTALANPVFPFIAGTYDVAVVLKNNGSDTLTSVNIDWQVNLVSQNQAQWTGTLLSGDTAHVTLTPAQAFNLNSPVNIVAWVSDPNGLGADLVPANDTLETGDLYPALAGTYTIGGTSPDFPTFSAAVLALDQGGVADSVEFLVRNGTYTEQISINEIKGNDASRPISFTSESGDSSLVILTFSATSGNNYTVRCNGVDHISFSNMTLRATNTSFGQVLHITNESNSVSIDACVLTGPVGTSTSTNTAIIFSTSSFLNEHFSLTNSIVNGGAYGIYYASYFSNANGTTITGNQFTNQYYRGMALYEHNDLVINDNEMMTASAYCCYTAIEVGSCENGGEANRNQIRMTANGTGMNLSGWYGTFLDRVSVTNNYISIGGGSNTHYGIYIGDGNYMDVAFNSINVRNTSVNSTGLYYSFSSNTFIRNNILANYGGGYSIYFSNLPIVSDYNDLFVTGANLGYYSGVRTDLEALQTASGRELNSFSVDPFFLSPTNYPVSQSVLQGAATPVNGITTDIEGEMRDALNPDIGADEFDLTGLDAGIFTLVTPEIPFPAGNEQVSAILINHGSDTLTSVEIHWTINGLLQPVINWNDTLLSGDTTLVPLNSVNFAPGVGIDLTSWTSNPNGMSDPVAVNDTAEVRDIYGALSGVYTIGGASPDFTNFATPVNALNFGGIVGPVTFNIRNGTYNEQISIDEIAGADAANPVLFQSESGTNTDVVLTFNANSLNNYTVRLNGADHVTFTNMTLAGTNTTYARVFDLTNGANHIQLTGNIISGVSTTNTSDSRALIYSTSSFLNEQLEVTNNTLINGSYGVWYGANTSNASGTEIVGNVFQNQYTYAIYLDEHNAPVVDENVITTNSTYTDFRGVYVNDSNLGGRVSANQIHLPSNGYGIIIDDWFGSITDSVLIANNFISIGTGTLTSNGIYTGNGSYQYFYYNSVSIRNTNTSSRAFFHTSGSNKHLNNNILANFGGGYAIYYSSTSGVNESDYNDLYTTGTNLGFRSVNHTNLAAWQSNTGDDGNSISDDPQFIDNTNLHVQNVLLNAAAIPLASVPADIDGEIRDAVNPDIGADEFSTAQEDAAIIAITSPVMPFAADLQNITVAVRNNGLDTLEMVNVEWEINGILQPAYNWAGTLLSGHTDSVAIGSFTFEIDTMYTIRAWTSAPNGMTDPETDNDTATVTNLYAALGGIYTIGGTTPDFDDFNSAVTTLNNGGVVSQVTFDVRNGNYQEQIVLTEILGANATNTITFRSESGDSSLVSLFTTSAINGQNYTVQLNGTDWIRFERMTLRNNSTTYGRVIDILNGATNNIFSHNRITGNNVSTTSTNEALVYSANSLDDFNTFSNNVFSEGSYGMYWFATSALEEGTVIEGNQFVGQYYMGVRLDDQDAPYVGFNTFTSNAVYCCTYFGVYSNDCYNGIEYINNHLFDIPEGYGFYLNNADGTALSRGLIANNFVHIGNNTNNDNYGIYASSSDYMDIYHNTVNIVSTHASSRALFVSSNFTNVRNNVLACSNQGYAFDYNSGSSFVTDYNDLYTENGANVGIWLGTNTATLANWQSTGGQDANSVSVDPIFASPSDLHVEELDLNNSGTPVALVTVDFDGEARNALTPDIGADEFDPVTTNDAQVTMILSPSPEVPFPAGVQPITVEIKNNGADTLSSLTIAWTANGLAQVPHDWTGTMLPGDRENVVIGSHNFTIGFGNDLVAYTQNPNGQPDNRPSNDTAMVMDLHPALSGIYTIGGSLPDFGSFSSAALALSKGGVLGPVTFNARNGTYVEQFTITQFYGASATNTVTFQAENGDATFVKLERNNGSANNYLVLLDGADFVRFHEMTFRPLSTAYTRGIELRNGANHTHITNCHFVDVNNGNDEFVYSASSTVNSFTVIQNNVFEGGGHAILLSGQNTGSLESGNQILDNTFTGPEFTGIYLQYQDSPQVLRNTISTSSSNTNYSGINCRYCDNAAKINRNTVTGGMGWGLNLYRCDGAPAQRTQVINNFSQVGGTAAGYGIYSYEGSNQDIFFNSVNISGTNTGSTAFYNYYGSSKTLLNNIFANTGGGWASYVISGSSLSAVNFNDLYVSGANLGWWDNNIADDLDSWKAISGKDFNSISVNPLFYSATDLHVLQVALDSTGSTLAGVTEDIDGDVRANGFPDIGADEFDYLEDDLGIVALISPSDGCDLTNAETVTVAIQNYGGLPQTGFDVAYEFPGNPVVIENVGALVVMPGDTAHFTFAATVDVSLYLSYEVESYTMLTGDLNPGNDALELSIENFQQPAQVSNMLPADGAINIDPPISFSWLPSLGALRYDLYLWLDGDPVPSMPIGQDLTQITFAYSSPSLIYGETYAWQVVAKNDYCSTPGPVQTFTLRELPDLIVSDVDVPGTAFSGQTIEVTWEVMNQAIGGTGMTTWYDYIYLSADNVYQDGVDQYLGGYPNLTALNNGQSYSNMKTVMLPNGIQGNYWIFVRTDRNNQLIEGNNNNNTSGAALLPVTLTPPPDLIVTSVIPPNQAFSGTTINVNWTVTNNGTGDVLGGTHSDRIYISEEEVFSVANSTVLKTISGLPALDVDESYNQSTSVTIPPSVFGDRYIHVVTDIHNQVFEFAFESNNTGTSDTMEVILTPPPDLVVTDITVPSSVDNRENLIIQWTVQNQGATPTSGTYYDKVYISQLDTFNVSAATLLNQASTNVSVGFGGTVNRSVNVTIPAQITGTYYFYVFTDANNNIFEFVQEDNNITRSNSVQVLNADLIISDIDVPDTTYSGANVEIGWTNHNQGAGDVVSIQRGDRIYLSASSVLNVQTATLLSTHNYSDVQVSLQDLLKQKQVIFPNGITGRYYIHLVADAGNVIFEHLNENNNTRVDSTWVLLSPWPDLRVDTLRMLPDTATAGDMLTVEFDVSNHGNGYIPPNTSWSDRVYISPNPNWNPEDLVLLKTLDVTQGLPADSAYSNSTTFTLPMLEGSASTGIRYVYVLADNLNEIYEHTDEGNNFRRSDPIFVNAPPRVDFKILNASTLPDTVSSGELVNLQWMILNDGSTTALWNYQLWYDGVYFSVDSVLNYYGDTFVKDFTKQGPVGNGAIYSQSQNFTIPYGISGDYYAFLSADHTHLTNNQGDMFSRYKIRPESFPGGFFKPIHIILEPSPDLEITTVNAPLTGISGQPVQVIWTVENNGMGTTSGLWTDKIYLSTDFSIDFNDPIIATRSKNVVLGPGGTYTDTINAFIPINKTGNFVLIVKTDANNALFEFEGEDNNTFFSFLTTSLPLPSDLIVSGADFDSNAVVGEQFMINYTLQNQGVNPATGVMQDLIYFSEDSVFDVSDIKITTPISRNISIGPALSSSNAISRITPGVPLGEYFVIVQTDILNNIYENSDTNNVYISPDKVMVSVQELPLDSLMADTLMNNLGIYYRIEIADTLEGEALLVTLNSHTSESINELYLSKEEIPTRSVHDFAFSDPFTDDQEIIVPEVMSGTYYLLAYGATSDPLANGKQDVDLMAEIVPFQIREVLANKGSNSGMITVRLEGARFEEDMEVFLQRDTIIAVGQNFIFVNSTMAFVTFNLAAGEYIDNWIRAGLPPGFYDVHATKQSGEMTVLLDGFEVLDIANPSFSVSLSHPPNTRVNRVVAMTLNYGNDGNVDIPVPRVSVLSLRGAPVALSPEELVYEFQDVSVDLRETGGPPDVLRPGAIGSVTIYARSSAPMTFKLIRLE